MANVEIVMPKMGESVNEATIIKWLKNEGDKVALDEPLLEIATDKVDSEIPSTAEGILVKKLFGEGQAVQVGQAVALIGTEKEIAAPEPVKTTPVPTPEKKQVAATVLAPKTHTLKEGDKSTFLSPLVKNIASREGLSLDEVLAIPGTGKDGRITKHDILAYLPNKGKTSRTQTSVTHATNGNEKRETIKPPVVVPQQGDEIIEMDRMRKLIADHMVMSKQVSPHVTSFVEADVTNLVLWRERVKKEFEKKHGEKITYTPIFVEAVARAIREFPMVNVSVDGTRIIVKKQVNIGMATALPSGNLIVPVIRGADQLNLMGLTRVVNDLATRARNNKLLPDEIQGGTYTITNVGTFGNVMGTPIINQPQVAILALGAIRKKPAVIETPQGDLIGIRHMMFLSHSYDHRVVDGALGGRFVKRVAEILESFDINTPI
jgi:2-oxoglutarate dehydrogenase E2 component (dihydrolipoamide succinyltransferase)